MGTRRKVQVPISVDDFARPYEIARYLASKNETPAKGRRPQLPDCAAESQSQRRFAYRLPAIQPAADFAAKRRPETPPFWPALDTHKRTAVQSFKNEPPGYTVPIHTRGVAAKSSRFPFCRLQFQQAGTMFNSV
jgi:hypothetical protein